MQIAEVPKLLHSNTASQDCFEMWKELNKESRLFPSGTCKKYKEKSGGGERREGGTAQKGRKEERERGREGGESREHRRERIHFTPKRIRKGNTRPHLSTCASRGYGEEEMVGSGSLDEQARYPEAVTKSLLSPVFFIQDRGEKPQESSLLVKVPRDSFIDVL